MTRTPLFRLIQDSLRLAHRSLKRPEPLSEILELQHAARISRRTFLQASAATAAAVAVSRCTPVTGGPKREPVIIVGAGIAGLTAAWRLRQAGVAVRIMEAQNRVGGRMFSLRNFFPDGQVAELGGELIDSGHQSIRQLAGELGITLDDLSRDDPSLRRDVWFFDGAVRTEKEVVEAFRPIAARVEADLATLTGDGDVTYDAPNNAQKLDAMTLTEWLDRAGVSGWIRRLLDVGYTTEFGLETGDQSALNLLTMIDTNPDPFRIYGDSDERFHVRGGNDLITRALASNLEADIQTNHLLEAIRLDSDGGYRCSFRRGGSSVVVRSDRVILALPFTLLRDVRLDVDLPPAKRRAINELGYGTNAKLMTGFAERPWRGAHQSNGSVLTDLPFQLCWEASRLQPGRSGILTNFTGGRHGVELGQGTDREQADRFVGQLERIFPGVIAARQGMREVRFHWPSFQFTRGSYASYRPGQWTAFRGIEGVRAGNLHFAGEHCSLEAQGFMEGGCSSGEAVAREILADLALRNSIAA